MNILIIIVTWNKKKYVLDLLNSITTLECSNYSIDILVVDNASEDGTVDAIKINYPQVNLICNPENIGGTGGFNTGLKWAFNNDNYKYLWLLDNDVLVHKQALIELVTVLEENSDIAIAGSTMLQLDYPWRVNEMGAFIDRVTGKLILNRHLETIPSWQGYSAQELLQKDADLTKHLIHCQPYMDVEYVAAASLLIKADVAKQAGIWRDYFIHFDDVEWCLRIADMGYRVVVSTKSLIWHLSAIAKIPTWILYYDNRNVLDLLTNHGASPTDLKNLQRYILKKAVYYHIIAKPDLAQLHCDAIDDFNNKRYGKKDIKLEHSYQNNSEIGQVFMDSTIKQILVSSPVNVYAMGIQEAIVKAQMQRPELQIDWIPSDDEEILPQVPRTRFVRPMSKSRFKRLINYWRLRGNYDLVIQSDYRPSLFLSWVKADLLFVNDETFCRRTQPKLSNVLKAVWKYLTT
ncbi:MAG: glycosyltransferase family 2 protein [Proteobacteria bacterium]|nr:glycosyltransferase family 2 protein [Pseudomonadota bacterium]